MVLRCSARSVGMSSSRSYTWTTFINFVCSFLSKWGAARLSNATSSPLVMSFT